MSGLRVRELQLHGVEPVPWIAGERRRIRIRNSSCRVERISGERKSRRRHVNPDLVGAPGPDRDVGQESASQPSKDANVGVCTASAGTGAVNGSQDPVPYRPDRRIDREGVRPGVSFRQGSVDLEDRSGPESRREVPHRFLRPCEEDQAGGPAPQPVSRRGVRVPLPHNAQQTVQKISRAGKGRKSGRLGDSQQGSVLMQNGEAAGRLRFDPGWTIPEDHLPGPECLVRPGRLSVHLHPALDDSPHPFFPGTMGKSPGQEIGQSLPVSVVRNRSPVGVAAVRIGSGRSGGHQEYFWNRPQFSQSSWYRRRMLSA